MLADPLTKDLAIGVLTHMDVVKSFDVLD